MYLPLKDFADVYVLNLEMHGFNPRILCEPKNHIHMKNSQTL